MYYLEDNRAELFQSMQGGYIVLEGVPVYYCPRKNVLL